MKLPFSKEKVIELVLRNIESDPKKKEEIKNFARILAKLEYKLDTEKKALLLDFSKIRKEGLGWKVYVVLDRESKKGFSFEI